MKANLRKQDRFDRMVEVCAGSLAAKHIRAASHFKRDEEKFRFGFSA